MRRQGAFQSRALPYSRVRELSAAEVEEIFRGQCSLRACLLLEESKSNGIVLEESKPKIRSRRAHIQGFSTLAAQDMAILVQSLTTPESEMTADQQRVLKRARNRMSLCFAEDRLIVFA